MGTETVYTCDSCNKRLVDTDSGIDIDATVGDMPKNDTKYSVKGTFCFPCLSGKIKSLNQYLLRLERESARRVEYYEERTSTGGATGPLPPPSIDE
jgi:hypothetical protein